jgi:hypothetical protein
MLQPPGEQVAGELERRRAGVQRPAVAADDTAGLRAARESG